jgi:hypothetical protein
MGAATFSILTFLVPLLVACGGANTATTDAKDLQKTSATTVVGTSAGVPSRSAQMICSTTTRQAIATALAMSALPAPTAEWANQVYTCTYKLPNGLLVLKVKELTDVSTAQQYFETLRGALGQNEPITGLAGLGLPGFKTHDGNVVFVKDNMTLHVDATGLPADVGPNRVSRIDFAYQVATNILGCWTGD